jgi:hypothetical protein
VNFANTDCFNTAGMHLKGLEIAKFRSLNILE